MLTGRSAFGREDVSETLAAILKDEPNWSALPPGFPGSLTRLMRRCVAKDARERLRDAGDARLEINEARREADSDIRIPAEAETSSRLGRAAWVLAGSATVLTAVTVWVIRGPFVAPPAARLVSPLTAGQELPVGSVNPIAISPDGQVIVYVSVPGPEPAEMPAKTGGAPHTLWEAKFTQKGTCLSRRGNPESAEMLAKGSASGGVPGAPKPRRWRSK